MTWPHPLTHPSTQLPIHQPIGGESPQISNLQTELKYLDSFEYYWIFTDLGGPPGVGGKWLFGDDVGMTGTMWGWQGRQGRWGRHYYLDKHVGSHLQFLYMCMCVHVCMHACMCVCTCVWAAPTPYTLSTHPQSCREPKTLKLVLN